MADIPQYAWAIDQAGPKLTAAILRGQHHDATSGGTGVSAPRALKVVPQEAPDNTVLILPGGGTAKSTYAGHENQSYQGTNFKPQTLEIPPTGSSSGGRTDLIIQRFLDPNEEPHPDYSGEYPIPAEIAKTLWQWRFECKTGMDRTAQLPYPHVKLSELVRPPNTTIVDEAQGHIVDLRELAKPQTDIHMRGRNLNISETESLHTGSTVWPTPATHMMRIPDFATRMQISAGVEMAKSHDTAGAGGVASGNFLVYFIHPDGTEINTQQTDWRTSGEQNREDLNILLSHQLVVPAKFRGQTVRVEFRARKYSGPNVYANGATSYRLIVFFEQEIA